MKSHQSNWKIKQEMIVVKIKMVIITRNQSIELVSIGIAYDNLDRDV